MTKEEITDALSEILIPLSFSGIEIKAIILDSYVNIHTKGGSIRINYGLLEQTLIRIGFAFRERAEVGFRNRRELQSALASTLLTLLETIPVEIQDFLRKYQRFIPRKS